MGGAPVVPLEPSDPSAAEPQKRARRKIAARTSGEAALIKNERLRGPTAREHKQVVGLIRKPTSQAMAHANRANSLKCTGPVTDIGKMKARLTAIKGGLTSLGGGLGLRELGESPGDLDQIRKGLPEVLLSG